MTTKNNVAQILKQILPKSSNAIDCLFDGSYVRLSIPMDPNMILKMAIEEIKKQTGVDLVERMGYGYYVDDKTLKFVFSFVEKLIPEEEVDVLYPQGIDIQEWYETTDFLITQMFGEQALCYAEADSDAVFVIYNINDGNFNSIDT